MALVKDRAIGSVDPGVPTVRGVPSWMLVRCICVVVRDAAI
jgi:hypothetical protein